MKNIISLLSFLPLLSPDAAEGTNGGADNAAVGGLDNAPTSGENEASVDPILTNDLTETRPDQPLVPAKNYPVEVVKVEQKHSESKGSNYLNIQVKTLDPVTSVTGEPLPAGQTFFGRIALTSTEKLTEAAIKRSLKRFMVCFGETSGAMFPLDRWVGKRGTVRIGFSKKTDEYPDDRNEVKAFEAPKGH